MDRLPRKLKNIPKLQSELKVRPESYWKARGNKMAFKLFHEMSERVPAYRDFLKKNKFNPRTVSTIRDFKNIPLVDKDNYLRAYPREMFCWDGKFSSKQWVISTTSGSTGDPFYFPRTNLQNSYYALTAELYLRENFKIQDRTTLYVDAFAMGAWIGGLFTYEAVKQVADKGYKISIITPGIHKQEVINSIVTLGKDFDQVILGCYPPMMKDILDLGKQDGINWSEYNLGLVFSAETFGEQFREHVHDVAGVSDEYKGSLNHFGTVDQGTLSHETPSTILIRKESLKNRAIFHDLFGPGNKQPTLTQYMPELFYFEDEQRKLICTSNSGLPLVRYDLKDLGGILSSQQIKKVFSDHGNDIAELEQKKNISDSKWNLPYVYVLEREDFSVKLAGGMIYPEEIRRALLNEDIKTQLTGKFTMEIVENKQLQPKLVVHVELVKKPKVDSSLKRRIQKNIVETLLSENSEFVSNYKYFGRRLWPRIVLWPYEHQLHFHGRGKQKWVKKN